MKFSKVFDPIFDLKIQDLQTQLMLIQQSYLQQGYRAVIVLEGVDAAGKGGLIRRVAWAMDPRALQVWPIAAPSEEEKAKHFLQRFWQRLPQSGTLEIFDRSWYGRVLVERVEGYAKRNEWMRAYKEINEFERTLCDNGFKVIKVLLKISREEQRKRFIERINDPSKHWKLSYEDFRNRNKWNAYEKAYEDMTLKTSKPYSKWHVIENDSKHASRIKALSYIVR